MRTRIRFMAVTTLALAGVLGAGVAQARTDVHVSIGLPVLLPSPPHVVVQPAPVYAPAPVYYQAPRHYHRGHGYTHPARWDRDGDGVPNRYDRVYNPRWDRDGDGVPNRYDRHPNRPGHHHRH